MKNTRILASFNQQTGLEADWHKVLRWKMQTMWPYSKIKHTQPELKEAECPVCTGPSTAKHHPDGT